MDPDKETRDDQAHGTQKEADFGCQGRYERCKAPKKSGPGFLFFVIYGVACAAAGIYADRNWSSQLRLWVGHQAESLSGFGTEQSILGALEQAGYPRGEIDQAAGWIKTLHQAKRNGDLSTSQLERYAAIEAIFQQGTRPNREQTQQAMEDLEELAQNVADH